MRMALIVAMASIVYGQDLGAQVVGEIGLKRWNQSTLVYALASERTTTDEWVAAFDRDGDGSLDQPEIIDAPFSQGGVMTTVPYSGLVMVEISGAGQASGVRYNDAFYFFQEGDGTPIETPEAWGGGLRIGERINWRCLGPGRRFTRNFADAIVFIDGVGPADSGTIPAYSSLHQYKVVVDLGSDSDQLYFGVSDCGFYDNTGSYRLVLTPVIQKQSTQGSTSVSEAYEPVFDQYPDDATLAFDRDNDGADDSIDAFPDDPTESSDTDLDGIGNNRDADDDGDGIVDQKDLWPLRGDWASDADNDAMPDEWENQYGLDTEVDDASSDPDQDGLPNHAEFQLQTSPVFRDTDADTFPDGFELASGRDFLRPDYRVATRSNHSCALTDGGIQCWGNASNNRTSPPTVSGRITGLDVGLQHSCAMTNSEVICWGANYNGEQAIPFLRNPTHLAVGEQSVCAIDTSGVKCWGWNGNSELEAPMLSQVVQLDAGAQHYCALDTDGVKCWGWNGNGETNVPELLFPQFVDAGRYSSCAIDDSGIVCWGLNAGFDIPDVTNPRDVAVGACHACALGDDGVVCWGASDSRVNPPAMQHVAAIEAGDNYTCALHSEGISCWGIDSGGASIPPDSLLFDVDGDGITQQAGLDKFPIDATEWADFDSDGVGDNADADDDADGVPDTEDLFPYNAAESADSDGDGVGDNADALPFDASETKDFDSDGVGDNSDNCLLNSNSDQLDTDSDGAGDACDSDDDGDGLVDEADVFPLDPDEQIDSDGDGVGDNSDAFPLDAREQSDSDGDLVGDNTDNCLLAVNLNQADFNSDGLGDACQDSDGDSFLDSDELSYGTLPNDSESYPRKKSTVWLLPILK
jgi:hypothetical protein